MSVNDDETDGIGGSGYTLDDLADYADRGRIPAIDVIDANAECQAVLDSLDRLHRLSSELITLEAEEVGPVDEGWLTGILDAISREFRAGRDIPFPSAEESATVSVTEGALRELVRATGDGVPGALIGRTRIEEPEPGHARIGVTVSATSTRSLLVVAEELRTRIARAVERHSPFVVDDVDVTIVDIHEPTEREGGA